MDKIRILNLKVPAKHGVYDFEKHKDGLFEIDVEMELDLSRAGISDQIEDTIDYCDAVRLITETFTSKDYNLIESVGEKICKNLIKYYSLKMVKVKIRKPHAPIVASLDTVEIEIVRKINEN